MATENTNPSRRYLQKVRKPHKVLFAVVASLLFLGFVGYLIYKDAEKVEKQGNFDLANNEQVQTNPVVDKYERVSDTQNESGKSNNLNKNEKKTDTDKTQNEDEVNSNLIEDTDLKSENENEIQKINENQKDKNDGENTQGVRCIWNDEFGYYHVVITNGYNKYKTYVKADNVTYYVLTLGKTDYSWDTKNPEVRKLTHEDRDVKSYIQDMLKAYEIKGYKCINENVDESVFSLPK